MNLSSPALAQPGRLAAALSLAFAAAACGGGADGGSPPSEVAQAYAAGAIHGFGSIHVNGVRYDDSQAVVVDDAGASSSRDQLALGMVVEVQSVVPSADAQGRLTAAAAEIRVRSEIQGPVTAIDATGRTLTVLGQRVTVTAATVFDDELRGGLARLAPGDVVEVYGYQDAAGAYLATRIEREDRSDAYKLRGRLHGLDAAARTFRFGELTVSYAALSAGVKLAEGNVVRVDLARSPDAAGHWVATRLRSESAGGGLPAASVNAEIEGVVTAFTDAGRFSVNGLTVDASQVATRPAGLQLGARVEVEGRLSDGLLMARRVELEDDRDADDGLEIEGVVESVDAPAQTFIVRGVTVHHGTARFEGGTASRLAAGTKVEVKGVLGQDGNTLQANEVEFDG